MKFRVDGKMYRCEHVYIWSETTKKSGKKGRAEKEEGRVERVWV